MTSIMHKQKQISWLYTELDPFDKKQKPEITTYTNQYLESRLEI